MARKMPKRIEGENPFIARLLEELGTFPEDSMFESWCVKDPQGELMVSGQVGLLAMLGVAGLQIHSLIFSGQGVQTATRKTVTLHLTEDQNMHPDVAIACRTFVTRRDALQVARVRLAALTKQNKQDGENCSEQWSILLAQLRQLPGLKAEMMASDELRISCDEAKGFCLEFQVQKTAIAIETEKARELNKLQTAVDELKRSWAESMQEAHDLYSLLRTEPEPVGEMLHKLQGVMERCHAEVMAEYHQMEPVFEDGRVVIVATKFSQEITDGLTNEVAHLLMAFIAYAGLKPETLPRQLRQALQPYLNPPRPDLISADQLGLNRDPTDDGNDNDDSGRMAD